MRLSQTLQQEARARKSAKPVDVEAEAAPAVEAPAAEEPKAE